MSTTPPTPATTAAIGQLKTDALADVTAAKQAVASLSVGVKSALAQLLSDAEAAEGVSVAAIKKALGI